MYGQTIVIRQYLIFLVLLVSGLIASGVGAAEGARPIRIAVLTPVWGPPPQAVGLRDGLLELGYREGKHFVIGVRFTQGDMGALPAAARELVQLGPDIIFPHRDHSAKAAQLATTRIPIVFAGVNDPVGLGLVQSFARPGGRITGVTDLRLELGPKRLEVFREVVPGLKRVLYLYDPTDAHSVAGAKVHRDAARRLGVVLLEQAVRTEKEAKETLGRLRRGKVDGILRPASSSLNIPGFILEAAAQRAIPTMFNSTFWVERGALASYGPDEYETGRQAARLVDKIIKGADPAVIPVEVNTKIKFAINLKVAEALGLRIKPEVLYRANRLVR
jgi:putative ABC transport system substrate-binding protein